MGENNLGGALPESIGELTGLIDMYDFWSKSFIYHHVINLTSDFCTKMN